MLSELTSNFIEFQTTLKNLEQKISLEKQNMILPEKILENNPEFFINSGLYRWCIYALLLIIAYYLGYYLYAKILKISIWTILPKIAVPYKFLNFFEKQEFLEFILGEFTIRLKIKNGNVIFSEGKHLSDMIYRPLEELLSTKSNLSTEVMNQGSSLLSNPELIATATNGEALNSVFSVI
jgi:hypothetical protein